MIPVSCPVLGSQRSAHWERGHGGLSDGGCIDRRTRAVLADLPSRTRIRGPEIFVVRSGKA
eukprot:2293638-Prymnesium_polylepis.1